MLSGSWPGEIYLFKRKANGTYAAGEVLKEGSGRRIKVGTASAVALADWDGDKDLDLFVGNIDGAIYYAANEGSSTKPQFAKPAKLKAGRTEIKVPGGDAGPAVADWDGDGNLDLLSGSGSGTVVFYRNVDGSAAPNLKEGVELVSAWKDNTFKPKRSAIRSKIAVSDWNGDGVEDLLVGDFISGRNSRDYHGWVWVYLRKANDAVGGK